MPSIVVTGGPCSGKTSAIESLPRRLEDGTRVLRVTEAATLYHERGGAVPFGMAEDASGVRSASDRNELWEAWLLELKLSLENSARRRAAAEGQCVVVCDRGAFDGRAYYEDDAAWRRVLAKGGWREDELTARYATILHLSVAPEASYNNENAARTETYDDAARIGEATLRAWTSAIGRVGADDAPRLLKVPNVGPDGMDVDAKLDRCRWHLSKACAADKGRPRPHKDDLGDLALPIDFVVKQAHRVATAERLDFYAASENVLRHVQYLRRKHYWQSTLPGALAAQKRPRAQLPPGSADAAEAAPEVAYSR